MKKILPEEIKQNKKFYINEIKAGKIFIYPTDTLIGLGTDTTNQTAVKKILAIKKRQSKPFLIIVPSFDWIRENCEISEKNFTFLKQRLPGPYSFIVKLKNSPETVGIRIPNSWFTEIIKQANLTFITTSVNIAGELPATKIDSIPSDILNQVDYVIMDDETPSGKPSTIYDLTGEDEKIIR